MSNSHPLEVVDRGTSETQLQVGEFFLFFHIVLYRFRDHSVGYLSYIDLYYKADQLWLVT